jgi:hypothetical protein
MPFTVMFFVMTLPVVPAAAPLAAAFLVMVFAVMSPPVFPLVHPVMAFVPLFATFLVAALLGFASASLAALRLFFFTLTLHFAFFFVCHV